MASQSPWSIFVTSVLRPSIPFAFMVTMLFCLPGLQGVSAAKEGAASSVDADRYYEHAQRLYAGEDYREAVIQLKNALQLDTNHMPARALLGRAYLKTDAPRQAELELLNAREMGIDRLLIDIPLAETYTRLGKYKELLAEINPAGHGSANAAVLQVSRGRAFLKLGKTKEAEKAFTEALQLDPQVEGALTGRALVYLNKGLTDRANRTLDNAIAVDPEAAEAWFLKGKIAYTEKNLEQAVEYFGQALDAEPEYAEARVTRVACLIDLGRLDQAQADLDLLLAQPVAEPMANYLQAVVHNRKGEPAEAKRSLALAMDTLDTVPPELLAANPQITLLAGTINYEQGNFEGAERHLGNYLGVSPGNAKARQMMTHILLVKKQPEKAREMLEPLISLYPDDPKSQLLMGQIQLALGNSDAAAGQFSRVAARRPEDAALQIRLAQSLIKAGNNAGAIEILQQAHRLGGGNGNTGAMLAALLLDRGDNEQAIRAAEAVIEKEPGNLLALNILGLGRMAEGDLAAARDAFERALEVNADYLPARLNLGRVDIREGLPEKAKARYSSLLEDNPNQRETLLAMAELESSLGRPEQAVRWWEKIHDVYPGEIEAGLKLIEFYLTDGKPDKALAVAQGLRDRHPENYRVGIALGVSQMAVGKEEEARAGFRKLSELVSGDARKLAPIAGYQKQLGDLESAHATLLGAVESEPDWLAANVDLALLEIRMGKMDDALGRALKLQVMMPDRSEGPFLEGEVHLAEKNYAKAERAFLRAWEVKPDSAATMRLYQVRKVSGKPDAAMRGLEAWGRLHPEDPVVGQVLARVMIDSGKYADAREAYEQMLTHRPEDPDLLNSLAMLYQMTDDPRALKTAQKAHRLAPENPYVADTLGWVLVRNGKPEEGLRHLRKAKLGLADLPDVDYHLALALHALNRDAEARTELKKALRNEKEFMDRAEAEALLKRLN